MATFTAKISRRGQTDRLIPSCINKEGYLVQLAGNRWKLFFDKDKIGNRKALCERYHSDFNGALAAGLGDCMIKLGVFEKYSCTDNDAEARVRFYRLKYVYFSRFTEEDNEEDGIKSQALYEKFPYPKTVSDVMRPYLEKVTYQSRWKKQTRYVLRDLEGLEAAIAPLGWRVYKKNF